MRLGRDDKWGFRGIFGASIEYGVYIEGASFMLGHSEFIMGYSLNSAFALGMSLNTESFILGYSEFMLGY